MLMLMDVPQPPYLGYRIHFLEGVWFLYSFPPKDPHPFKNFLIENKKWSNRLLNIPLIHSTIRFKKNRKKTVKKREPNMETKIDQRDR